MGDLSIVGADGKRPSMMPQIVMPALRKRLDAPGGADQLHHVIIELNVLFPGNIRQARVRVSELVAAIVGARAGDALRREFPEALHPYVFAELTADEIKTLLERDGNQALAVDVQVSEEATRAATSDEAPASLAATTRGAEHRIGPPVPSTVLRAIYKIWDSTAMKPLSTVSIRTIKADAGQSAFAANGEKIVWAVLDSGIDGTHPHFKQYGNLKLNLPLAHRDFTPDASADSAATAQTDPFGHGTHVAGIIAGAAGLEDPTRAVAAVQSVDRDGIGAAYHLHAVAGIRGMAPKCKLLSLRILDKDGVGDVTAAINALEYVMQLNAYGEHIAVHGVNISAGYLPDVHWHGTGQTPLCKMVDRVVASGVPVVVAAGNTGYVVTQSLQDDTVSQFEAAQLASINDPGNARSAITVGSTHREQPHTFGVSYFSSKGPTADGRLKPDVVAPGERIISCASGATKTIVTSAFAASTEADAAAAAATAAAVIATPDAAAAASATASAAAVVSTFDYVEDTGTSMAAPHVSGVLAAFLSVRPEYIGRADDLRDLVIAGAVDLKRDSRMQGAGLVDLMRMLQAV